jgi:uncharacterized membrane protein YvbJ
MMRLLVTALLLALLVVPAAATTPRRFASPEDGVTALVTAVKADDQKTLLDILGPEGRSLVYSVTRWPTTRPDSASPPRTTWPTA